MMLYNLAFKLRRKRDYGDQILQCHGCCCVHTILNVPYLYVSNFDKPAARPPSV